LAHLTILILLILQGYEKFKKAADAVKDNGGAVLSGQVSILDFLNHLYFLICCSFVFCIGAWKGRLGLDLYSCCLNQQKYIIYSWLLSNYNIRGFFLNNHGKLSI
jgi:hypothetical protein